MQGSSAPTSSPCTGKTVGENIADAGNLDPEIIRPIDNPYYGHRRHRRAVRQPGSRRLCGQAVRRRP